MPLEGSFAGAEGSVESDFSEGDGFSSENVTTFKLSKSVTFRCRNHSGIAGLNVSGFRGLWEPTGLREEEPLGRPRALEGGRAKESELAGRGEDRGISL